MDNIDKNSYILFKDKDVCILKPDTPYGILVFTKVDANKDICSQREGLYSYNELMKVKPELNLKSRANAHIDKEHDNLIFFRAPYNSDISSFEASYGYNPAELGKSFSKDSKSCIAVLRVDPEQTFVYSSEIRALGTYNNLLASRIPLKNYLTIIENNINIAIEDYPQKLRANLITYKKECVNANVKSKYPFFDYFPIERNTEIVVNIPHIPHEWLVECVLGPGLK